MPEVDGPAIGFKSVVALFALEAGTGGGFLPEVDGPAIKAGTGGGLNEVDSESLEAELQGKEKIVYINA